jgi:RNA polymerase sigma-70 factor (ECF subfamily)
MLTPDSDPRADALILERMVARDARAVGDLYDRYHRLLFGLIVRILKDRSEAEEVLQEVFVQAWTRADSYDVALGSPAGWLVRIARNRAIDRLRANAARTRALDAAPFPPPVESPEAHAAQSEQQRTVARALGGLPHDQRELIEHAYFLGLTQTELAARFRLPLGTVKTRIRTGMLALRQQLQQAPLMEQ